jgi:hypothetical protein
MVSEAPSAERVRVCAGVGFDGRVDVVIVSV